MIVSSLVVKTKVSMTLKLKSLLPIREPLTSILEQEEAVIQE